MFKSKVLSKKDFDALMGKVGNYDKIVAAVVAGNPNLKEEDVTFETIEELMKSDSSDETDPDLQSKFDTLQGKYDELVLERDGLQDQVNNLLNSAAEETAVIASGSEVTAKPATLLDFANKNAGDTAAIINAAMEDGFLPKQK